MNPQAPTPTPADDQPVSDIARRVGPPLAIGALVLTLALLAWLALAPTAIAGPLEDAPFTVPATLVLPPDDAGCLQLVQGDGTSREHCLDELARPDDRTYRFTDAYFDTGGRLLVVDEDDDGRRLLHVDIETGEVVATLDETAFPGGDIEPRTGPRGEPIEAPEEDPGMDPHPETFVYTEGDRVLRVGDSDDEWNPEDDEVVLDFQGPPGYRLDQAALSPDGDWVVVLTGAGEVAVAPTDGSAAPHVWAELPEQRWIELARAIQWDG